jgi:hypothetical protein
MKKLKGDIIAANTKMNDIQLISKLFHYYP